MIRFYLLIKYRELRKLRTAVVIGARQFFGFQLTLHLLENGYEVMAYDYPEWQSEKHNEQWMFIGRNANLHYREIQEDNLSLTNCHIIFIPLVDFFQNNLKIVQEKIVKLLQAIGKNKQENLTIVIILPFTIPLDFKNFYIELFSVIQTLKENEEKVVEYTLPLTSKENYIYFQTRTEQKWLDWNKGKQMDDDSLIDYILDHLENV